jgi:glycosyltransferase involved in cell wall biosynthesis
LTTPKDSNQFAIIIPVYNEAEAVGDVIQGVLDAVAGQPCDVIAVDDASEDGSSEVLQGFGDRIRVIRHPSNHGYGASLKTGIRATRALNVIFLDSDGQHDPCNLPALIDALKDHEMVFGERAKHAGVPMVRRPGKWILHWVCNFLAARKIPDINCGLRGGRRRIYMQMLDLLPDGFSFSTTSLMFGMRSRFSTIFVPVIVHPRKGSSTVRIVYDGMKTLLLSLRLMMLFDPMRAFGYPAIGLMAIGVLYQAYIFAKWGMHIEGGAILSLLAGIIIFHFGLLGDQIASLRKEMSSQTSLFWEDHERREEDATDDA